MPFADRYVNNTLPESVDVVVVGFGVAGASAALEAYGLGADVLIVERASAGGGASAESEGIFYLGGGTALQRDLGFKDSPSNMFSFLRASTTTRDDAGLRQFCEDAADHFEWLEAHGVPFERRFLDSKVVASRSGEGLLTTGNEFAWPFRDIAHPVPRGHQARSIGRQRGGASAMAALTSSVQAAGIHVSLETVAVSLVVETGRVVGLRLRKAHIETTIGARRGVVLATGSFNMNQSLTAANFPVVASKAKPLGIDSNDGSGLNLAQEAGAVLDAMDGVIATGSIYPPEDLLFGVVVNSSGCRFVAEDSYHGKVAHYIEQQPDQRAWLLIDELAFDYPRQQHPLVDIFIDSGSLETRLQLPRGSIDRMLDSYNADVSRGVDTAFHKHPKWCRKLDFPLAAFDVSMSRDRYHFIALGGVKVDGEGRALNEDGVPILGLYAVGAVAAHLTRTGAEYASGMSLGPGSYFGRRAGRHIMAAR